MKGKRNERCERAERSRNVTIIKEQPEIKRWLYISLLYFVEKKEENVFHKSFYLLLGEHNPTKNKSQVKFCQCIQHLM